MNKKLIKFYPTMIMIPAAAMGIAVMIFKGVSPSIWIQNGVFLAAFSMISILALSLPFKIKYRVYYIPLLIFLFLLTFIQSGTDGVHRWIALGSFRINVSLALLPLVLILMGHLFHTAKLQLNILIASIFCLILLFQPDASQLTGFAVPAGLMLVLKCEKKIEAIPIMAFFLAFILVSWYHPDSLPPVYYVEEIMVLAKDMGFLWFAAGFISLALIPLPFLLIPPKGQRLLSLCIGIYYTIIIFASLAGNFPVPVMGYGISPYIGLLISSVWYGKQKLRDTVS